MSLFSVLQNSILWLYGLLIMTQFGTLVRSCFFFFLSHREYLWNNGIFDDFLIIY